jgi:hypothetical protein
MPPMAACSSCFLCCGDGTESLRERHDRAPGEEVPAPYAPATLRGDTEWLERLSGL